MSATEAASELGQEIGQRALNGDLDLEDASNLGAGFGGALGSLLKAALGAIFVGAVHFGAHMLFGNPEAFAAAGVTPAGIAASIAGAIVALVL